MKTIEELADLGAAAALPLCHPKGAWDMKVHANSTCYLADKPAREAFAAAVRDAVLADQPAADMPTWRPIAELPEDDRRHVYWDGEMYWHGNAQGKCDATHFLAPPKPDPFEAWWEASGYKAKKETARQAWNAAREAKA